jgi:hypothetical protein
MNYELKNLNLTSTSYVENQDGTITVSNVIVISGVVGDTYGFSKRDVMPPFLIPVMQSDSIKDYILSQATSFVQATYPPTV